MQIYNKALNTPAGLRHFMAWTVSKAGSLLARRYEFSKYVI
jgi:hypothetical protein